MNEGDEQKEHPAILVTGATGNVDRNVVRQLIESGEAVWATSPMSRSGPCWRTDTADGPTPSTAPTCCRTGDADFLLGFEDHSGGETDLHAPEEVDPTAAGPMPTAANVTAVPARTFAQRAQDHAQELLPD
ncbi:hypothetical protein [Streptomyces lydicus]|uniref:hypothetical protein n=1 Tax=Streptomyces lydicus TaxID=47763 RepID=UPI00379201C6